MHDRLKYMDPLPPEKVDRAISTLSRNAAYHREAGSILRAVKARKELIGRAFSRVLVPEFAAALPGYHVDYTIREEVNRRSRVLIVTRLGDDGKPVYGMYSVWYFALSTSASPRITTDAIDAEIAREREDEVKYTRLAVDLPTLAIEYNSACDYMRQLMERLSLALVYGDYDR